MNEADYHTLADSLFETIESSLDNFIENEDLPVDYENGSGVLSILLEETDTQVIISKQTPAKQIWVAAKSGGFHCDYKDSDEQWYCNKTHESLSKLLTRTCGEQSSLTLTFPSL